MIFSTKVVFSLRNFFMTDSDNSINGLFQAPIEKNKNSCVKINLRQGASKDQYQTKINTFAVHMR